MKIVIITNQPVIMQTLDEKSLLPSLYEREVEATLREDSLRESPLFNKEGSGEILGEDISIIES